MNPVTAVQSLIAKGKLELEKARTRFTLLDVVMQTGKKFSEDDGGAYAAALTYYMFFSIFPILLVGVAVLGYLTIGNETLRDKILDAGLSSVPLIRDVLTPDGLAQIEERRGSLALVGAVLALYSGTGAIVAVGHALNKFHGIRDEPNWFGKRVRALRFLLLFAAAAVLSLALGTVAGFATNLLAPEETAGGKVIRVTLTNEDQVPPGAEVQVGSIEYKVKEGERFGNGYRLDEVDGGCISVSSGSDDARSCITGGSGITWGGILAKIAGHVVGFIVGSFFFAAAYKLLPSDHLSWRDVLPGALIAALAFEILKEGGSFLIEESSGRREATFGTFAISATLLVACFLLAQVTLIAGQMNEVLRSRRLTRQKLHPQA